jgi:hypothetical protein
MQALKDWFICVPNGVGAAFAAICLIFCFIFPHGKQQQQGQQQPPHIGRSWSLLRLQSVRFPANRSSSSSRLNRATTISTAGGGGAIAEEGGMAAKEGIPGEGGVSIPLTATAGTVVEDGGLGRAGGQSFMDLSHMRWRTGMSSKALGSAEGPGAVDVGDFAGGADAPAGDEDHAVAAAASEGGGGGEGGGYRGPGRGLVATLHAPEGRQPQVAHCSYKQELDEGGVLQDVEKGEDGGVEKS